ncbi:MAG: F0F1 ATP synthase subunit A [Patescibacteria group bacterium]
MNWLIAATETGPPVHITPSPLFEIGSWQITNSVLYGWIVGLILIVALVSAAFRSRVHPKSGFVQIVEAGTEFIVDLLKNSLGSRAKAIKYAPYFAAIFFFIALSNLLGLLPVIGESFTVGGNPAFRPFTADLNGTLAASLVSLALVQYFAIRESGPVRHLRHYFAGNLKNPLTYVAGIYELFGEIVRLFSLALRLFLNIAIGEIIISVFAYLGKFAAPITALPFLGLEVGVAVLQAYIFVMLTVTYLSLAIKHSDNSDHEFEDTLVHTMHSQKVAK